MNKKSISALIPKTGKELSFYSGTEIIDRLGEDVIRSVVASILSGGMVLSNAPQDARRPWRAEEKELKRGERFWLKQKEVNINERL